MLSKVYCCWIVYGRSWRVVCLPIVFWPGSLTCAVLSVYYDVRSSLITDANSAWRAFFKLFDMTTVFFSCNIATNLFSTCMTTLFCLNCFVIQQVATGAIIYQILRVANASGNRSKRLYNTARILAESGILYTSMTVFHLFNWTHYHRNIEF